MGLNRQRQSLENVTLTSLNFNLKALERQLKHFKQETGITGFIALKDHYDSFVEDHLQGL